MQQSKRDTCAQKKRCEGSPYARSGSNQHRRRGSQVAVLDPVDSQPSSQGLDDPRGSTRKPESEANEPRRALPLGPATRARQAHTLSNKLAQLIDGEVSVTVTDNRSVMITVRRDAKHKKYAVRLHHLFADPPPSILTALARYIELDDCKASARLGVFIDENDHLIERRRAPRSTVIRTTGRVHDLRLIFDELNRHYFGGELESKITWGRNAHRGRRRSSIRLGSFSVEEDLIRVHPGLDQAWVPALYVGWVVYHEMLHAVHPIRRLNGRLRFHSESFQQDEQRFLGYELVQRWERQNIAALLRI
jgi:hypothetical protein